MSEYQFYEFQALDRPLTESEQAYLRTLSSRVVLSPRHAVFVYHYGDFHADPKQVLSKHFDAMLYMANWGSRQLTLRFPKTLIDYEALNQYCVPETIELETVGDYYILNIDFHDEGGGGGEWLEGEGVLSSLVAVRADILRGDYRAPYLAWLNAMEMEADLLEDDEDLPGRPVPPGLTKLSAPLDRFIDFFEINTDLIEVAAEESAALSNAKEDLTQWLPMLPEAERITFLTRLLKGESNLDLQLMQRVRELAHQQAAPMRASSPLKTARQLVAAAEQHAQDRKARERREAEAARVRKLEAIAPQQETMWNRAHELIAMKQTKAYDEAIALLVQLRDLAEYQKQSASFQNRLKAIYDDYPRLSGLLSRLRSAGLRAG